MEHSPSPQDPQGEQQDTSIWRSLRNVSIGWRRVAAIAFAVTTAVAIIAGFYYFLLVPTRTLVVLPFRLTFDPKAPSAERKEQVATPLVPAYPNGLPFAPSDVIGASVVQRVFGELSLQEYCQFEQFRQGLVVQEGAMEREMLDATFQPLLGNVRLTPVERLQLEEQYRARVASLPSEYQLTYVTPSDCGRLPSDLLKTVLAKLLESWADESETKRGVLKYQVGVVQPTVFDEPGQGHPRIVSLNRVRSSIQQALQTLDRISELPGALSVRSAGNSVMTLPEVRGRLVDLRVGIVEPLIAQEARIAGSGRWIQEARNTARREKEAAQIRADAYRKALREFSGSPQPGSTVDGEQARLGAPRQSGQGTDTQALIPQIDKSFIDRIVQLSAQTSDFRQKLTEQMVEAEVDAITFRSEEAYYEQVLQGTGGALSTAGATDAGLTSAVNEGRRLVTEMNAVYGELNRVGLKPSGALYATAGGVRVHTTWPFADFIQLIATTLLISLLVTATAALIAQHARTKASARNARPSDEM